MGSLHRQRSDPPWTTRSETEFESLDHVLRKGGHELRTCVLEGTEATSVSSYDLALRRWVEWNWRCYWAAYHMSGILSWW